MPQTRTDREAAADLMADGAFTVDGAAEFTGIGRNELYKHMRAGELVYAVRGSRRLIPRKSLVELLASFFPPGSASSPQLAAGNKPEHATRPKSRRPTA